jgi:hypothetical protein
MGKLYTFHSIPFKELVYDEEGMDPLPIQCREASGRVYDIHSKHVWFSIIRQLFCREGFEMTYVISYTLEEIKSRLLEMEDNSFMIIVFEYGQHKAYYLTPNVLDTIVNRLYHFSEATHYRITG